MTQKILLVPPFKNEGLRVGQYLAPSIGLYRIKSYLDRNSPHNVTIFDCNLYGKESLEEFVKRNKFNIIGISSLHPTLHNDIALINDLKKISPESTIVWGGQGAVFNEKTIFDNSQTDCIVHGLGEMTFLEICNALDTIERNETDECDIDKLISFRNIDNISYSENGQIIRTKRRCITEEEFNNISNTFDFASVPYEEYWEYMEKMYSEEHLKIMKNEGMLRTIRLFTSSHCPMGCSFCSSTNFFKSNIDESIEKKQNPKVNKLNAQDIFRMICSAKESHPKTTSIYFADDDFLIDKKRISELCKMIIESKNLKDISFFCLSRVDNISVELLSEMKKANFKFIIYGVESFSNKVLKDMNKKVQSDDPAGLAKEIIQKTLSCGIDPLMNIILFYPTSDIDDIVKTIESSLDVVELGTRLTVYTYVEAYSGSDILVDTITNGKKSDVLESISTIDGKDVSIPHIIYPASEKIKILARDSILLRDKIVQDLISEYSWKGVIPHPVYGLALFLATYELLKRDTKRIKKCIDKIMKDSRMDNNETVTTMTGNNLQNNTGTRKYDQTALAFKTKEEFEFPNIVNVCVVRGLCPCKCIHCPVGKISMDKREESFGYSQMRLDLFKKIVDEISQNDNATLRIHAVGEPIIWKDFVEGIRYAKSHGTMSWLFTSLFTQDKRLIEEIAKNVSIIEVSINSFERKDYLETKGIDAFDLIYENLKYLREFIDKNKLKSKILISRVQSIDQEKDDSFIRFWKSTGLGDDCFIRSYHNYNGRIEELSAESDKEKLIKSDKKDVRKISPCIVHWARFNINSDGKVAVCFNELFKKDIPNDFLLGDLNTDSIKEIWQSDKMNMIRISQLSGDYSEMKFKIPCTDCKFCQPLDTKRTTSESQVNKIRNC